RSNSLAPEPASAQSGGSEQGHRVPVQSHAELGAARPHRLALVERAARAADRLGARAAQQEVPAPAPPDPIDGARSGPGDLDLAAHFLADEGADPGRGAVRRLLDRDRLGAAVDDV